MSVTIRLPSGQDATAEATVVMIGSGAGCEISLPTETSVRPQHAKIRKIADRWFIESQGDWLLRVGAAEPGRSAWIVPGDSIRLAPSGPVIVFQPKPIAAGPGPAHEPTKPDERSEKHNIAVQQLQLKRAELMVRKKDMLPRLYQALGSHVFEKRLFEAQLPKHYRKLQKLQDRLTELKKACDGNVAAGGFGLTEERKKALERSQALSLNANTLYSRLGEAAYAEFGERVGPPNLIEPIQTCLARMDALKPEITALAKTVHWPMTPQNLLLCFLAVIFISSLIVIIRLVAA
jgi:hypothetical protein